MNRYSRKILLVLFLASSIGITGCSKEFWGGAAVGAVGAGAGYELSRKRQMDRLEEDRAAGRITQEEYQQRRAEIEKGSLIY